MIARAACWVALLTLLLLLPRDASAQNCNLSCGTYVMIDTVKYVDHPETPECSPHRYFHGSSYCCQNGQYLGTYPGSVCADTPCGSQCEESGWYVGKVTYSDCDAGFEFCEYHDIPIRDDQLCDGRDGDASVDPDVFADEGCAENTCSAIDKDEHPLRLSSGRVETNPLRVFSAETPVDVPFGVILRWGSHQGDQPAGLTSFGNPSIKIEFQTNHYLGYGWLDPYSDRLYVHTPHMNDPVPAHPPVIEWRSFDVSRKFTYAGPASGYSQYTAAPADFELRDYGPGSNPRFRVIRKRDRKVWEFSEFAFTSPDGDPGLLGLLTRISVPPPGSADFQGGYFVQLARDSRGRIDYVDDAFGRRLDFVQAHSTSEAPRVVRVDYIAGTGAVPVTVANFVYRDAGYLLERIDVPAEVRENYFRFYYQPMSPACENCRGLLQEIIVPATYPLVSMPYGPAAPGEKVLEGHIFAESATERPRAVETYGPDRHWAYLYGACGANCTRQLDLHQPGGPCDNGACAAGFACWSAPGGDNVCYRHEDTSYDGELRRVIARGQNGFAYDTDGHTTRVSDAFGRTTYSWTADGLPGCVVRNDDDDEAGTTGSGCDLPPVGPYDYTSYSYVTNPATGAVTATAVSASLLPGGSGLTRTTVTDIRGLTISETITGSTRNTAGSSIAQTRTTTTTYDTMGRITLIDGPRAPSVADDRIEYTYHSNPANPNDLGRLHQIVQHVGTASSYTTLVTTHEQYDLRGVARKITDPSGLVTLLSTSDWITWTVSVGGAVSTYEVNPDGSIRKFIDPDGTCLTLQYGSASSPTSSPTLIKLGGQCGVLPIDSATGEVVRVVYEQDESDRPILIQRLRDGVERYRRSFTYNDERQFATQSSPHGGGGAYTLSYASGILASEEDPACPGPLCGRAVFATDTLGRPSERQRFVDQLSFISTRLGYASGRTLFPTSIERGAGPVTANSSSFVYDDFGHIVESTTPDAGTTRLQYDVAGNLIKVRDGVGSSVQRTRDLSYDSIKRLLAVDHDSSSPVDCTTAPAWTPIADEEYRYDNCDPTDTPPGFACANPVGRRTLARVTLSCNASGARLSRGTWHSYDVRGNVAATAIAFRDQLGVGPAEVASYSYTAGGRPAVVGNPIATYDSRYSYANGRVSEVRTTNSNKLVANDILYEPFGPMRQFKTNATLPTENQAYVLVNDVFALDYSPTTRTFVQPSSPTYQISATYDVAGFQTTYTTDLPLAGGSTRYDRDAAGRITCEYGAGVASCPTSAASSDLRAKYGFFNGAGATEPPDNRSSVVHRFGSYAIGIAETSTYAAGKNRLTAVVRAGGTSDMALGHDGIGRRTFDRDKFDAASRRDYTYLPNGRLGTVAGQKAGQPYLFSLTYDTDGRPVHVVKTVAGVTAEEYDFYYNLDGELRAARKTVSSATPTIYRWSFDYLNGQRIGAQREKVTGAGTTVKRFVLENDFRGSPRRIVDSSGVTYFGADYLASGWRNTLNYSVDMYVPFALDGQIVLEGSEAVATGTYSFTRPPILLNHWRELDPFTGSFLEPDPLDVLAREDAEGYLAARGNPLAYSDPRGLWTIQDCPRGSATHITWQIYTAAAGLAGCVGGGCPTPLASRAIIALLHSRIRCNAGIEHCGENRGNLERELTRNTWYDAGPTWDLRIIVNDDFAFRNSANAYECSKCSNRGEYCMAKTLAHEALHLAGEDGGTDEELPSYFRRGTNKPCGPVNEARLRRYVDNCVTCR